MYVDLVLRTVVDKQKGARVRDGVFCFEGLQAFAYRAAPSISYTPENMVLFFLLKSSLTIPSHSLKSTGGGGFLGLCQS